MQTPRPQPTEPAPPPSSSPAHPPVSEPSVDTTRRDAPGPDKVPEPLEARLPKLPHERDESGAGMTSAAPDPTIQQAYRDVQRGLQDTDRGPPAGKAYQKQK